jgi:autotransporter-associated beta strand protein
MKNNLKKLSKLIAAVACGWMAAPALFASNDIWVGNTDNTWGNAANWTFSSGSAVNPTGDYLIFGVAGSSGSTLTNSLSGYSFSGITFNSGATAFNFIGNSFTLAGGVTNNASSVPAISNSITLGGNETISAASGNITLGGAISDGGNGYGLTFPGSHNVTITNGNTYSGQTLIFGGGTLVFSVAGTVSNSSIVLGQTGLSTGAYLDVGASTQPAGELIFGSNLVIDASIVGGQNYNNLNTAAPSVNVTNAFTGALELRTGLFRSSMNPNSSANMQYLFNSFSRQPGTVWSMDRGTAPGVDTIASQTAANVNIVFNNPPALIGAGGTAGTTTIGVVPGAFVNNGNATYDTTYGLRALTSAEQAALAGGMTTPSQNAIVNANTTLSAASEINALAINGSYTITLGGNTLTVDSGEVSDGVNGTIGSTANDGFLALGSEGIFNVANARTLTVNSVITGNGGLTVNLDDFNGTSANCALAGTNIFTGVTRVLANASLALHLNNSLALQNSTLDYNNYGGTITFGSGITSFTFGGLKGAQNLSIPYPLNLGGDGDSTTYSGILSGAGGLIKTGAGALTLTGANTYSGGTILTGGQLNINYGGSSSANSSVGTAALTISNGIIDNTSGSAVTLAPNNPQNWDGNFTFNGSSSLNLGTGLVALGGNEQVAVNANTLTVGGVISGSGDALTKAGSGTLVLSAANTYSGNTAVSAGTLALTGNGSLASPQVIVNNGATLDVSGLSSTFTLGGSQSLLGGGTVKGSVTTTSGSQIYADSGVAYGTNVLDNNLTLVAGAGVNFQLGTSATGANDLITVGGNLTLNGNNIMISAPSSSANLDTQDYTLFTVSGSISGSFAVSPVWVVQPLNAGHYAIETSGNKVILHYSAIISPTGGGSATPGMVNRNQATFLSVTATNGGTAVSSVTVNTAPIGGGIVTLAEQSSSGSVSVWTNTVTVSANVAAGSNPLTATIMDSDSGSATVTIPLTVLSVTVTWDGGSATDNNWSDTANWAGDIAPLGGDAVTFAGTTRLAPLMDSSYVLSAVTFSSSAGAFAITNAPEATLTLEGAGVTNNSANTETLSVPVSMSTAQTVNAANGNIVMNGVVSGSPSLTLAGNNALTLSGANSYGGGTIVNGGTVIIANNSALGSGALILNGGSISNAAGASYSVPNNVAVPGAAKVGIGSGDVLTLSGIVSGNGNLAKVGGGSLVLPTANNISGSLAVNAGTLVIGNNTSIGSGLLTLGNGAIANIAGNSYSLANTINLSGAASTVIGTGDTFTFNGAITNTGSLALNGSGTVSISGNNANTYSGGTILSTGVLQIVNASGSALGSGALTLAGGTLEDSGFAALTISNNLLAATNTTSYLNPTAYNGNGLTLAGNLSGAGNIVVNGSGATYDSFVLAGSNSAFGGTFTVNANGTYQRFAFGNTNAGSPNAAFVLNSPGTDNQKFIFGSGTIDLGSLSGAGTLRNDSAGTTILRIGDLNTSTAFTGTIVGTGGGNFGLLKVGTGTLTMTNNNTYNGLTEVARGALVISVLQGGGDGGALSSYQVDDGATLGIINYPGLGLFAGSDLINLTLGTNSGATMSFTNVDDSSPTFGEMEVNNLTNNGTCTVVIADNNNIVAGNTYPLISYDGNYTASGAGNFILSSPYVQGYVTNDVNNQTIDLVVTGISSVNPNPTDISVSSNGSNLTLSWPSDHLGWYLQVQTNSLSTGLGSNWVDVPGSSSETSAAISINPANPAVFYRLSLQP